MQYRKIGLALALSATFGLLACGDSDSSTSSTVNDEELESSSDVQKSSSSQKGNDDNDIESSEQSDDIESSESSDEDNVKSSSSKAKSSSSKVKSSSSKVKSSDSSDDIESSDSTDDTKSSKSNDDIESSESNDDTKSSESADNESSDEDNVKSSSSKAKSSSSSVEIDPEAFTNFDTEQCKGKENGTKVNIGGIPFTCMNGQISVDEDGINELIGNKYKGCEESKIEDDVWIFYSSPMGSWNTEKFKWITETSYEYTTFPVPPDQMEAYEELADLGLGPDKQIIKDVNREEVYAKYCGQ